MEVHHSHHLTHRKKWSEYLLEFLMLFLAVFLGFLAENQREHFVEAHRAKDYAKSFLSDLKNDTLEIRATYDSEKFRLSCIDTIISIATTLNNQSTVPGRFYYYSRFVSNLYTLEWNNSTINQLVQSGNLRYFKNKELVKKINIYYAAQQNSNLRNQISHEARVKASELRDQILQGRYYFRFSALDFMKEQKKHVPSQIIDSLIPLQLPLETDAHKHISHYINLLSDEKWRRELYLKSYLGLIQMATEIINLIKDEYDLE